ncbi:MAG: hypothetical protein QXJ02_01265 [Candidatus Bathyarchaeia archaeon]
MKITALKEHECFCCGKTIKKGEECFASFVNPSDAQKNEFDVIYTCSKCIAEESCRTRIERRSATST